MISLVLDKKFNDILTNYGADIDGLKANLEAFIANDLKSIVNPEHKEKPKQT